MDDVLRAVTFGGSITITSLVVRDYCGSLSELGPRNVPFQPPKWVFGVVWPILYVTTGAAWVTSKRDVPLIVITSLCCSWLVTYVCMRLKKVSALVLLLAAVVTMATVVTLRDSLPAFLLLSPLALWTGFASYLNVYDAIRE